MSAQAYNIIYHKSMLCTKRLFIKHAHIHRGSHSSTFGTAATRKIVFASKVRPCEIVSFSDIIRYVLRLIVLHVYIMMFVYPCVDIFTRCDSVVCLHCDVCLSLCRHIYKV